VPKAAKEPAKSKKPAAPAVVDTTTSPSEVSVNVLNGSGISQLASQTAEDLTSRGFKVIGTGDANNSGYTSSIVQYPAASDLAAVNTLKAQLGDVQVEQDSSLTPGTVQLILGSSFTGLTAPHSPTSKSSPPTVASIAASDQGITADTNICDDQSAFAGPDS
jgi:hypothetical protein